MKIKSTPLVPMAVLALALVLFSACAMPVAAPAEEPAAATDSVELSQPIRASDEIIADAVVVPARYASLSLPTGGIVAEVLAAEGDAVQTGQVLLRLEAARQIAAVAQAGAGLRAAQAKLDELKAGARTEEIAAAQAALDAANAQFARLEQGPRPEEIAAAEASVAAAQAALQKLREGPNRNERIAAQADVNNALAAVQQAQTAYDRIAGQADAGMRPESLQLQQATNAYNAAKARLDALNQRVTAADIAGAQAQVRQAQAQLDALKAPARPADLAAAQAEIDRAQAQLHLLEAGARAETIAAVAAEVASAEAALQQANAALAETELKTPFAGTVAELDVKAGEQASPGAPLLTLADLSGWRIETDDLTELDVVNVEVGDTASIRFDAIPDLEIPGKVVRIEDVGRDKLGDITYTVIVQPDRSDPRLRWNMTAVVTIQ
ncbi:MAG: efflux RND transporter periplasmic adaptor subunit [Caldilineales bacterium]|nr:efflux RND transporter periplasmic adaptor subunit [Caldilineales bacterium]